MVSLERKTGYFTPEELYYFQWKQKEESLRCTNALCLISSISITGLKACGSVFGLDLYFALTGHRSNPPQQ